jgi:hypothetical protein
MPGLSRGQAIRVGSALAQLLRRRFIADEALHQREA